MIERQEVVALGWHELIEDWWALLERRLLAPAERVLMEDLIAFTEQHFAHLLAFTTLARAGENDQRRQRRLVALMRAVMPGGNVEPMRRPDLGAVLMLDEARKTTQRIALMQDGDALALLFLDCDIEIRLCSCSDRARCSAPRPCCQMAACCLREA